MCDTMQVNKLLGHPSEGTTKKTANEASTVLTGDFRPCVEYSKTKACRRAVPKTTGSRATKHAERSFADLVGGMHVPSLGGSKYVMIFVGDRTRFKVVNVLNKNDATSAMRSFIAGYVTPGK